MVEIEEIILPFIVPAITALIIFVGQWYKRGSVVALSATDIKSTREKIEHIEIKLDKIIEKINIITTDTEIFRYRLKSIERVMDDAQSDIGWRSKSTKQPFRPKDSNGE